MTHGDQKPGRRRAAPESRRGLLRRRSSQPGPGEPAGESDATETGSAPAEPGAESGGAGTGAYDTGTYDTQGSESTSSWLGSDTSWTSGDTWSSYSSREPSTGSTADPDPGSAGESTSSYDWEARYSSGDQDPLDTGYSWPSQGESGSGSDYPGSGYSGSDYTGGGYSGSAGQDPLDTGYSWPSRDDSGSGSEYSGSGYSGSGSDHSGSGHSGSDYTGGGYSGSAGQDPLDTGYSWPSQGDSGSGSEYPGSEYPGSGYSGSDYTGGGYSGSAGQDPLDTGYSWPSQGDSGSGSDYPGSSYSASGYSETQDDREGYGGGDRYGDDPLASGSTAHYDWDRYRGETTQDSTPQDSTQAFSAWESTGQETSAWESTGQETSAWDRYEPDSYSADRSSHDQYAQDPLGSSWGTERGSELDSYGVTDPDPLGSSHAGQDSQDPYASLFADSPPAADPLGTDVHADPLGTDPLGTDVHPDPLGTDPLGTGSADTRPGTGTGEGVADDHATGTSASVQDEAQDSRVAVEEASLPELPTKAETVQAAQPASGRRVLGWTLNGIWLLVTSAGLLAVLAGWIPVDLPVPEWVPTAGAVAITTAYAYGLAVRTGGRPAVSGALALALTTVAAVSRLPVLLAGAAVATAVLSAVLAVMATKPAARFSGVVRECLVAILVAGVGAFAVEAYQAEVSVDRMGYLTLGLSLLFAIGLVYRLGAGLQGLGKRGTIMLVSGVGLLFVTLAYTEALAQWGSPSLREGIEQSVETIRTKIGAMPHPIEVLLGFPALAWGVSTRARRRQGWWVAAFGAAGLAGVSVSLLDSDISLFESGLSLLYSAALGLALGFLVVRADSFFTGARGRRARQLEEASAHRPEPGRMQPLL